MIGEASSPMLGNSGTIISFIVVLLFARAANGRAQDASSLRPNTQLEVDNDLLALRGRGPPPDYDYTHGARITITRPNAPGWIGRALGIASRCAEGVSDHGCLVSGLAVGQEIYTPRHNSRDPVTGDRPHAAWLYGGFQLQRLAGTNLQALDLRVGITGPPALGEQVQNGVHRLLHNHLEAGWEHQLPTRVGVMANYDATAVLGNSLRAPSRFIAGNVGATFGTLRREVRVGGSWYYGFGPVRAPIANAPLVARPGHFYVLASYEQSLVLYDAFVEGYGAAEAVRLPLVGEACAGAGWRFTRFAAEYRYTSRGREYRAEPGRHAYGTLGLSIVGH